MMYRSKSASLTAGSDDPTTEKNLRELMQRIAVGSPRRKFVGLNIIVQEEVGVLLCEA